MKVLNIQDPFLFGEWFDIQWFHSCYLEGVTKIIHERLGYGLTQVVAELEDTVQRFYFSRSEWTSIGEKYLKEVIENPKKLQTLLQDLRDASDALINFCSELKKKNISDLTREEQIHLLEEYHEKKHTVWALGQVTNVLELENSFLTDYLKAYLKTCIDTNEELIQVFQVLVTPRELSKAQQEEREMLSLALYSNPTEELKLHLQKYSWLHFGWTGPSLTYEYFERVHHGLFTEGKAEEKLLELKKKDEALLNQKELYTESFHIPADKQILFSLLEQLLFLKAHRMDALFMSYEAIQPLLKKIAQDYYLSLHQVYTLYIGWVIENLKKDEFDIHEINEIAQYSVRYYDGKDFYLFTGKEAEEFIQPLQLLLPQKVALNELKGECAFPGKVVGNVCIVNRASEMKKFHDGDILVSNVTDPSLLPIMKRASAFVTNMGGLTCHAAIVARELQVPCVVGTKVATHVFHDGDMIEVDATTGTVKKI